MRGNASQWLKLKSEVLETRSVFSVVGMLDYPGAKKKRAGGGVNPHRMEDLHLTSPTRKKKFYLRNGTPMSVPGRKSSVTRTVSNSSPLALCAVEKTISARKKTKKKNKQLFFLFPSE